MKNRHAFGWMVLVFILSGAAVSQSVAQMPAVQVPAAFLAQPSQAEQVPQSARAAQPNVLAAFLVMFIPWAEAKPTPAVPGAGGGNGQNNGGGNGQNNGGGQNTGGGNGQNTGGSTDPGGNGQNTGGSTDPGGGGQTTGGSTDPGGSTGLGSGIPQSNPEPASLVITLLGAGLLGLAALRRRRWSLN